MKEEFMICTYWQLEWQFAYSHRNYDSYSVHSRVRTLLIQHK